MSLHPAVAAVRLAVRRALTDVDPGRTVMVACSGGADSLALLSATVFEGRSSGWRVVGATVDHGLQEGSAQRAQYLVSAMAALGVDETVAVTVSVDEAGMGPEAAAREARYAALDELAQRLDATAVLLGHTRDDQAETVLLGLARGSGGRSIAGMRRGFGRYLRPLLDVSRADTRAACEAEELVPWEDPHNADPRFTRVRVRQVVLPMLEAELGPGVAVTLARTADQLRGDMELLDELADAVLRRVVRAGGALDVATLAAEPAPLRRRAIRLAALAAGSPGSELFHEHVLAVDALLTNWRGQRWIDLPGHLRVVRRDGALVFEGTRG